MLLVSVSGALLMIGLSLCIVATGLHDDKGCTNALLEFARNSKDVFASCGVGSLLVTDAEHNVQ